MEVAWKTIKSKQGYNASPKREKSYPILFVWTNKKKKNNKRQSKENMRPFDSKLCSYAFVYVYILVQSYL